MKHAWIPPEAKPRAAQAEKIQAVLRDYLGTDLSNKLCLEVGCADGRISVELASHTQAMFALEIDQTLLLHSTAPRYPNLVLIQGDGRLLPFSDQQFDVIILAQVYEHMQRQQALVDEIYRVLKQGGVCFFSGPNRWQIIEPHYFLPFLAWLPHELADIYLRISGRGKHFDIYPRSYWFIKQLWRKFKVTDYTWQMIREPEKFSLNSSSRMVKVLKRMPVNLVKRLRPFYANYNWILEKSGG